uniref:Interaptin-like n=1 Tax=Diabrotica virgifera virgifera TaxID=50390 RepID=A0A6P7FY18_DIAVI
MKKQLKEKDEEIKKLRNQIHQLNEKINGLQNTIINSQEKVIETIDKRFDELKNENQTTDIQINEKKSMTAIPKKKIEDTNNNIANTKNLPITPTTKTNEDFPSLPKKVGKDNSVPSTSKVQELFPSLPNKGREETMETSEIDNILITEQNNQETKGVYLVNVFTNGVKNSVKANWKDLD